MRKQRELDCSSEQYGRLTGCLRNGGNMNLLGKEVYEGLGSVGEVFILALRLEQEFTYFLME